MTTRSSPSPARARSSLTLKLRQRGQAVIWLLGTLAASAAVLYGVFNVGQLHAAKEKTVNAADAAALAGANVEARMLNLIAYNNRSMIANEVLLVQMLSIESWLGYFHEMSQNIGIVLDLIPGLDVIGAFLTESSTVASELQTGVGEASVAIIGVLEVEKAALATEHTVLHTLGGVVAENAATNVVAANRSTFSTHTDAGVQLDNSAGVRALTFIENERQWLAFTKQYTGNQRTDAKQVLLDSRDDFSATRNGNALLNFRVPFINLQKLGGSQLQGFTRWEAEDTLEYWVLKRRTAVPIGWGRTNADQNGTSGSTWSPNYAAQRVAHADGAGHSHSGWSGVPSVFDIADKTAADRATLGMDFVVAVKRAQAATMTTSNMGMGLAMANNPTGSSEMPERLEQNQLSALAKARVSFQRPQRLAADRTASTLRRVDSAKEYGSLFSPYWEARLVDFSIVEKAALVTAMGINPAVTAFTPGAQ